MFKVKKKTDRRNPPPPLGMQQLMKSTFCKPEINPIVRMVSEEKAAQSGVKSVVHLLDQFFLQTPPASEDEGESVKQPREIVSVVKSKAEPAAAKCIELDDSIITKNLFEFVAEEKRKRMLAQQKLKEKKKREGKADKEEKITNRHKHSNTSSPPFDELPCFDSSPNRSSKHSKSSSVDGRKRLISPKLSYEQELDMEIKHEGMSSCKSPPYRSSSPLHHKSPKRRSPSHRISRHRSPRHESSPSSSPDGRLHRRRSPIGSSTRSKQGSRSRTEVSKGSVSPDRIRVRKSPIRDKFSHQKSSRGRSRSQSRSPDRERRRPVKESLDKSQKTAAECRRPAGPSKFKKFPIADEYSQILAEEMKKRQLLDDSDDEPSMIAQKLGVLLKNEEIVSDEDSVPLPEDQQNLVKYELGIVSSKEMKPGTRFPQTRFFKEEDFKQEFPNQKGDLLNSYYCHECQIGLNSEPTWQSHINGRKHAKMLQLKRLHEIAKGSIEISKTPAVVSEDVPRFASAAAGKMRSPIVDPPLLLPAILDTTDRPLPGLGFIQEIVSHNDVNYYCELCDAPCGPSSIMPHLTGYKHQLRCLKEINPGCYERNRERPKKSFEAELSSRLFEHEKRFGRGIIKVLREQDDPTSRPYDNQPGPSWRNTSSIPVLKKERIEGGEIEIPNNETCLDTSKGDFFCKLCDSHMNNLNMWEAHVRGKRHLKNAKKIPGTNISKLKSVKAPGAQSKLEELIKETARDELIVGLDFIRETRGPNGEMYNCFLCGSCSTNYDIIDHILLPKHRLRYLEKLVTEGKPNDVTIISQMEFHDPWFRQTLVENECHKMVKEHGVGKVEVYVSK